MLKNRAKRLCVVTFCVLVILSSLCLGFTANAASLPAFSVSSASQLRPGDTVSVTVDVCENRGYCAGEFLLSFDSAALTPISIEAGDAASEYFVANPEYGEGEVFFAVISTELMSAAGTVATVNFTVNESVVLYSGELELSVNSLVGNISVGYGLNSVKSTASSGEIHAAKQIFVPHASESGELEELSVNLTASGIILGATTFANTSGDNIAANFGSLDVDFYSKSGAALASYELLTTGCTVKVFDGAEAVGSMVLSVKQDVNGDYSLDGEDAFIASLVAAGAVSADELAQEEANAADANGDGVIDEADVRIMTANGLK